MRLGTILSTAVNAVFPIVLLIALGYWLRKIGFLTEHFVKIGNKFAFRICLFCMLFVNVYSIDGFSVIQWDLILYVLVASCVLFLLGFGTALVTTKDLRRRGVILQCVFRSNFAIIGLPFAAALAGEDAVAVAAVISAFALPLFNVFAVIALTVFVKEPGTQKRSMKQLLLSIIKNPIILGAVAGLVCIAVRELQRKVFGEVVFSVRDDLNFLYTPVNNLNQIASPFALVILGGQFSFSAVKGMFREIATGTLWRIVFAPLLGIGGAVLLSTYTPLLSCGVNEYPALIAFFGTPTAISGAIMAGEMGNDEQLATQLVVWTSVGSILTIFLITCVMMGMGLLPM